MFEVIVFVEIGPRQRGLVDAGAVHEAVRKARIRTGIGARVDANKRVTGADMAAEFLAGNKTLQRFAQMRDGGVVDMFDLRECGFWVVKLGGSDEY